MEEDSRGSKGEKEKEEEPKKDEPNEDEEDMEAIKRKTVVRGRKGSFKFYSDMSKGANILQKQYQESERLIMSAQGVPTKGSKRVHPDRMSAQILLPGLAEIEEEGDTESETSEAPAELTDSSESPSKKPRPKRNKRLTKTRKSKACVQDGMDWSSFEKRYSKYAKTHSSDPLLFPAGDVVVNTEKRKLRTSINPLPVRPKISFQLVYLIFSVVIRAN